MFERFDHWALNAYCDDELDAQERASVEKHLQENADARRVVDHIKRQKQALRNAYAPVLDEEIPAALLAAVKPASTQSSYWPKLAIAASVAMLLLGSAGGWFFAHQQGNAMMAALLPDRALNAHEVYAADFKHPVEVAGSDVGHLQTWLSRRIGIEFKIPDLTEKGYSLVGGRLLAEGDKPAGLLMYENGEKQRITIYVAANAAKDESSMRIQYRGKLMSCYWVEPDLVYAVVGERPEDEMIALTQAAHDGFDS